MRRSKAKSCSLLDLCSPTKSGLQGAKPCRYGRPPHHLLLPVPAVKSPPCCLVGQGSAIRCYGRRKSKQTFTPTRLLFALNSVSSGKDEKCLAPQRVSLLHCVGLEARVPGPCRDQAVRTSRFSSGVDAGRPKHLPVALAAHKKRKSSS